MHAGSLYAESRARITELVGDVTPAQLVQEVPATPGWTVKDVVGHLTGVAADVMAGRLEGAGTPPWTAAQVAARRGAPLADTLDEWAAVAPALETMLATAPPPVSHRLVSDIACHEHDLRGALVRPGARDSDAVDQAIQAGVGFLDRRLVDCGGPGMRLRSEMTEWVVGPGKPVTTLSTDSFTLFRLLFGRRSRAQMAALAWTGDAEPYLGHLALFGPATSDLDEG
jgi:uncharacterized protein (TIGR03083 family)